MWQEHEEAELRDLFEKHKDDKGTHQHNVSSSKNHLGSDGSRVSKGGANSRQGSANLLFGKNYVEIA